MEKFWPQPIKKTWKWNIHQLGDLPYFTTNFAPKVGHVLLEKLWQNSVDIQNGYTCGLSVLVVLAAYQNSLMSSKNNGDLTSSSLSTPPNVEKSRLKQRKS